MPPLVQRQRRNLLAAVHRDDWYQTRTTAARAWLENRIIDIVAAYTLCENENGEPAPEAERGFARLKNYYDMLGEIKLPPQDPNDDGTSSSDSDGD